MTRRRLLSMAALALAMVIMAFAGTTRQAMAQQDVNCCKYFIDVADVPDACFRIPVWTRWSTGVFGPDIISANGVYSFAAPAANGISCPPAAGFVGVSLTGPGGPYATFNNPLVFNNNGCCLVVRIAFDINGCPYIYIRRVSC